MARKLKKTVGKSWKITGFFLFSFCFCFATRANCTVHESYALGRGHLTAPREGPRPNTRRNAAGRLRAEGAGGVAPEEAAGVATAASGIAGVATAAASSSDSGTRVRSGATSGALASSGSPGMHRRIYATMRLCTSTEMYLRQAASKRCIFDQF